MEMPMFFMTPIIRIHMIETISASTPKRDDKPKYEKKRWKICHCNKYKNVLQNYSDKHKGFIPRMVDPTPE